MANRNIFRAIHERKWLSIEYKNGKEEITKYFKKIEMRIKPPIQKGKKTKTHVLHQSKTKDSQKPITNNNLKNQEKIK